jgi:hypothetical protein
VALGPAIFDRDILEFDIIAFLEPFLKCGYLGGGFAWGAAA